MQESGVIEKAALVYGQMDEPPGVRLRVALSRADRRRVLPRREEPGRAALRRQHLPVRAGRLRGVDAARPHAFGRGLPADARRRDGRAAGAHHLDQGSFDHVAAGRVRARRRLHRPRAVHHVHPPRRDHRARPCRSRRSASTRPSTRWRRRRTSWRPRSSVQRHYDVRPADAGDRCSATRSSRTSSPSSVSTSSPKRTGSPWPGPARSSGSCRSRSSSARCSPVCTASSCRSRRRSRLRGARQRRARRRARAGVLQRRRRRVGARQGQDAAGELRRMPLDVQLVSPEQVLYTGEAEMVVVRTLGGGDIAFEDGPRAVPRRARRLARAREVRGRHAGVVRGARRLRRGRATTA